MLAISICVTAVVTGIFTLLVPDNSFDKVMQFSISLFFVAAIVSPIFVKGIKFDFKLDLSQLKEAPEIVNMSAVANNQFLELAVGNIEKELERKLIKDYDAVEDVTIFLKESNNLNNNSIFISKAIVTLKDSNTLDILEIKQKISDEIAIPIDAIFIS